MKLLHKVFLLFALKIVAVASFSQSAEDSVQIENLSKQLLQTILKHDLKEVNDFLPDKPFFLKIIEKMKGNYLDSVKYEEAFAKIDAASEEYYENVKMSIAEISQENDFANFKTIEYLSSKIGAFSEELPGFFVTLITAKIQCDSKAYLLKYECGKLDSGWYLGFNISFTHTSE